MMVYNFIDDVRQCVFGSSFFRKLHVFEENLQKKIFCHFCV